MVFSCVLVRLVAGSPNWQFSYVKRGEGGIRTLGSLLSYGALAKRCFQPLSHLTNAEREYCEELGFSNLQFGVANTDVRRVLAISSELPIVDRQLIKSHDDRRSRRSDAHLEEDHSIAGANSSAFNRLGLLQRT